MSKKEKKATKDNSNKSPKVDKRELSVEEVTSTGRTGQDTKDKGLFAARMSKVAEIQGIKFDIRPLPNIVQTYITGKMVSMTGEIDLAVRKIEYLRFGVTAIYDSEGIEIKGAFRNEKVMGRQYEALTYDFIDESLPPDVLDLLFVWIQSLTHLSADEVAKLDFTIVSEPKA